MSRKNQAGRRTPHRDLRLGDLTALPNALPLPTTPDPARSEVRPPANPLMLTHLRRPPEQRPRASKRFGIYRHVLLDPETEDLISTFNKGLGDAIDNYAAYSVATLRACLVAPADLTRMAARSPTLQHATYEEQLAVTRGIIEDFPSLSSVKSGVAEVLAVQLPESGKSGIPLSATLVLGSTTLRNEQKNMVNALCKGGFVRGNYSAYRPSVEIGSFTSDSYGAARRNLANVFEGLRTGHADTGVPLIGSLALSEVVVE